MKKITPALSVLILALIACNAVSAMPTITPLPLPVLPTLPPATTVPTVEASPTAQPATAAPQPDQPGQIQFGSGDTWVDVPDRLNAGESKTYTVYAMKDQVMSVSIHSGSGTGVWGYFPVEVKGIDGTVLCPVEVNYECTFWHGAFPSTQSYQITVKSAGDLAEYTLRVAIDPPGKTEQTFQYKNPATLLTLAYSDQFAPASFPSSANNKINPELVLQFIDTNSYQGTNLSEAYFLLGSSSDPQMVATCTEPGPGGGGPEQPDGNLIVNGYNFVRSQASGAGAGNYYDQEIHRTVHNNVCYEVVYFIHYTNIGNYTPGTVTEFDRNALMQKFNDILTTFSIP